MSLFDSSALLCFLLGEPGEDVVEEALARGAVCASPNWSEVAQKILAADRDWPAARTLLMGFDLVIEPVTTADAESAARAWRRGTPLSLADRFCVAVAERLDLTVLTADAAWGTGDRVVQVR